MLVFALIGGGLAEAFEVLHLQAGGVAPPGLALRLSLWIAYAVLAGGLYGLARLLVPRRALGLAAAAFAALVLLPWLNFAYLPRAGSLASILGTLAAAAALLLIVPQVMRLPRLVAALGAALVLAVNAWGLVAAAGSGGGHKTSGAALPFNVMVVLIDTLRADHLGAYGYGRPTSPHFDALAQDGVLFERTVAQAAWTKPSVASLLTGRFVKHHGVVSSRDALSTDLTTLAEELGGRGYRTAAFSANPWITPEFRFDQGFDQFESGRAMSAQLTSLYKLLKRVDRFAASRAGLRTDLAGTVFWGTSGNLGNSERDRLLTDAAVDWIAAQGADPFFMYMHLIGPHDPYNPPAEYVRPFREAGWDGKPGPTKPPARVQTIFDQADPLGAQEQAALMAQYDGAIAFADAQLGRLVDALRRSGALDRTLIVVTADHGEEFYEHHNWRHGNQLYNEIVHVPLLFRLPERLPAARRSDVSMLVDVFPTLVNLVDGSAPDSGLDGRALFAATSGPLPAAYAEHFWFDGGNYVSRMVERGELKLKETKDEARGKEKTELYDLAADSGEQRNLLENAGAVRENGVGELQDLLARFGDKLSVGSAVAVEVDQSTKERLRALGYAN
ncbi:MAG: sulfatase [Deltaproteobacteria bacterium]|nr:sulfatase [Deltaproteobacteria bacterium]